MHEEALASSPEEEGPPSQVGLGKKLQGLIDLVLENTPGSMEVLRRRHNMHRLEDRWAGCSECHVANSGDWLVIWSSNGEATFFERTNSHYELFK